MKYSCEETHLALSWQHNIIKIVRPAGVVPFKADSILGLYDKICNAPLEFPPDVFVSDSLKHLITRLLDKDPETRISLTSVMSHHWVTHNGAYPLPNIQVCARVCVPACHDLREAEFVFRSESPKQDGIFQISLQIPAQASDVHSFISNTSYTA